jgi:hypothetical protein
MTARQALEDLWQWATEARTHLTTDPVPDGLGASVIAALAAAPAEPLVERPLAATVERRDVFVGDSRTGTDSSSIGSVTSRIGYRGANTVRSEPSA